MNSNAVHKVFAPILAIGFLLIVGCDGSSKKFDVITGEIAATNKVSGETNCKSKTDCPVASMDVFSPSTTDDGGLLGYKGEPVPWSIRGFDLNSDARRVAVLLSNFPPGSKITPDQNGVEVYSEVQIVWTPTSAMKNKDMLIVVLRDLDRCLMMEEDDKRCHVNSILTAYDVQRDVSWEIQDRNVDESIPADGEKPAAVTDPDCVPQSSANSDAIKQMIQMGVNAAQSGGGGGGGGAGWVNMIMPFVLQAVDSGSTKPPNC